jgi:hypothetical protein
MATTGDVELSILDGGGAVVVPGQSVQVVIGTSSSGTAATVVATRSITTLVSTFGYGPLVEAAALCILAGGTPLCVKATSNTVGTSTAVTSAAAGTSVCTVSVATANDTYDVKMLITTGGTIAATGIRFKISLDAGRSYGPEISLGTAVTYVIPQTGLTLAFAAGTMTAGGTHTFSTTEPLWNTAGVQACLNALQASQYAVTGWGSMHIVGPCSGANASTIQGYIETLATGKIFTRAMVSARDAIKPVAWGGAGETEAVWTTAVLADFAAVSAKRLCVGVGHYNMPSAIPNNGVAYRYRRPLAWSLAARQVQIPPQRHAGRVKDGSLQEVIIDPTSDPSDGFVYHDERINPGYDGAKFASARTRLKKKGFFIANPNLMSDTGSVFTLLPLGNVMDIACGIVNEVGTQDINEDIRLNKNGTITENEAIAIERRLLGALNDNMVAKNMLSAATVVVDRSNNIATTSNVNVAVTIYARGYILQETVVVGFGTSVAA